MFLKSKLMLSALLFFTVCSVQPAFAADETNETLMPKGMWKDPDTGLIWRRCGMGQTWNGGGCVGEATRYNWWSAMKAADKLVFAGKNDWRLPTTAELSSLLAGQVLHGQKAYAAVMEGSFESSWNSLSFTEQSDYKENFYFVSPAKFNPNVTFGESVAWTSIPTPNSNSAWRLDLFSDKYYSISQCEKVCPGIVLAVRSTQPIGNEAFLQFSKLVKQMPSNEAASRKIDVIQQKEKEQQVLTEAANKKKACSRLYIGKAVKVNLCSTLFGCSNYDAEITGIGNVEASAKITESGNEYGKRHELNCEEFKY